MQQYLSTIEKILGDSPIKVIDAGARNGFNQLPKLNRFIQLQAFEPDPRSFNNLNEILTNSGFKSYHTWQMALGNNNAQIPLNLALNPDMSSLREFDNTLFDSHFGYIASSDAWKQSGRPESVQQVQANTLDNLFGNTAAYHIDLLKMDTQGSEFEILEGAKVLLNSSQISIIKTESNLVPMYKGQKCFSELDLFIQSKGFTQVDCLFYPQNNQHSGSKSIKSYPKLYERQKAATGLDVIYLLNANKLQGLLAVRAALVLGHWGYFSWAVPLLEKHSGLNAGEIESLLLYLSAGPKPSLKQLAKLWLPPIMVKIFKKIAG